MLAKGRERWRQSDKGKKSHAKRERFRQSDEGKANGKRFRQSDEGKAQQERKHVERQALIAQQTASLRASSSGKSDERL